ncbi:hypothetical protein F4821DRAFT_222017, partial [Hypoxylon rubiginosum]
MTHAVLGSLRFGLSLSSPLACPFVCPFVVGSAEPSSLILDVLRTRPRYTKSFRWAERRWDDLMPSTKDMASIELDLPDPLGPMIEV